MTESFTPRRRDVEEAPAFTSLQKMRCPLTLAEILVLFSSSSYQSVFLPTQDPVSVSLRTLALVELALRGSIYVDSGRIVRASPSYLIIDPVHDEVYCKIKSSGNSWTADTWISLLNGETLSFSKSKYHLKNARRRIGKILIQKGIFQKPPSRKKELLRALQRTPEPADDTPLKGAKASVIKEVAAFLAGAVVYRAADALRLTAIVCALSFCCLMDDVLLTLPPAQAMASKARMADILSRFRSGMGNTEKKMEWSVFCILKPYLKLASWL